jgi:hypothetical protein
VFLHCIWEVPGSIFSIEVTILIDCRLSQSFGKNDDRIGLALSPRWCNGALAIRPKFHEFRPGRRDGFLRAIKIRSTPSFGEEVKPETPCRKILRHKNTSQGQIHHFLLPSSCFQSDDSTGIIARELWWTNQDFSPVDIIPPWFFIFIYHLGIKNKAQFTDVVSPHRHDDHHHVLLY